MGDLYEKNLTRPILGIENRTAEEVLGIMADRVRAYLSASVPADVAGLVERLNKSCTNEHDYDPDKDEAATALAAMAAENERLARERDEARDVLSGLSSYVGAGLGDDNTPIDDYGKRIRWGIDHMCDVLSKKGGAA